MSAVLIHFIKMHYHNSIHLLVNMFIIAVSGGPTYKVCVMSFIMGVQCSSSCKLV